MVYTQRDIHKLVHRTYPGKTYEEQEKILRGIMGIPDGNFLPVESKVQAFIDLNVRRYMTRINNKGRFKTVEDNRRACVWHARYDNIADEWDWCQSELDKAGIRITE